MTYPCVTRLYIKMVVRGIGFAFCLVSLGLGILSICVSHALISGLNGYTEASGFLIGLEGLCMVLLQLGCLVALAIGLRFVNGTDGHTLIKNMTEELL